jgi:hypothetical protein
VNEMTFMIQECFAHNVDASGDSVAIDAVAAKMMGFDAMKIPYIRMAHEDGLRVGNLSEIEVFGDDVSTLNFAFAVGDDLASRVGDTLWFGPLKSVHHFFTHTPGLSFRF